MATHGKKYEKALELAKNVNTSLPAKEALTKVKELAFAKFDESVDVNVNLGIDPSKPEQAVRGSVVLPNGTGRSVKILVFAKGDYADKAIKAGADYVGTNDLADKITAGWLDFNYVIATPDMMGFVGKLAKILGPRGLLPNVKTGTVTFEVENIIEELKKGKSFFKNNKSGQVQISVGKVSFDVDKLYENFMSFAKALLASKPASAKGNFIKKITVSSTMGPGFEINLDEVLR
jgi:large subunit ribosomal protein L1